ncbi:MAG: hypothetical protein H7A35_07550 [Planctomycetales bacterium]|nr:MAG: hypothetical protein H7A35_07550 [Planctomycetales bacterium]
MKTHVNWCRHLGLSLVALTLVFVATACGGGGGGVTNEMTLAASDTGQSIGNNGRGVGQELTVSENEIGRLSAEQQALLSDAGWNQPYIPPRAGTPIQGPSHEMLMAQLREMAERGVTMLPRGVEGEGTKGASWLDQRGFNPGVDSGLVKGQYKADDTGANGVPDFGCNASGALMADNGQSDIEDVIFAYGGSMPAQAISWVAEGLSTINHFNSVGGGGDDAYTAVYQLFADSENADPNNQGNNDIGEIGYRADLGPYGIGYGQGSGPNGTLCDGTAYGVRNAFWMTFNEKFFGLPSGQATALYNILIAPSEEETADQVSPMDTSANFQTFYFGNVSSCYGDAMIVGINAADSGCDMFDEASNAPWQDRTADGNSYPNILHNPVFGVILARWAGGSVNASSQFFGEEAYPSGANMLGWPVARPFAYNNGAALLNANGAYYAFGQFFEKGFMWWIDYDQNSNPTASDEAQMYIYDGNNTFCEGEYSKVEPDVFYGGSGDLGVAITVDGVRYGAGDWSAPQLSDDGTYYQIGMLLDENTGISSVTIAASAHGFGGVTADGADVGHPEWGACLYKHSTWSWRDGTVTAAGTAFDPSQFARTHTYSSNAIKTNVEGVYTIRNQVVDADDNIAYGDSLPMHLGHGGAGGGGGDTEVWVIRNDGGDFQLNLDALTGDLDALGVGYSVVDYSATVADDFAANPNAKVAIWYRGGPGGAGESATYTTAWTSGEMDNYIQLMSDGFGVMLMSQNHGYDGDLFFTNGWSGIYGYATLPASVPDADRRMPWASSLCTDDGIGFGGSLGFIPTAPSNFIGNPSGANFGADGTNAAERYTGSGSSGELPISFGMATGRQYCGIGYYSSFFAGSCAGPAFRAGIGHQPNALGFDLGFLSWGNSQAPDANIGFFPSYSHSFGTGKVWNVGYSWAGTSVTASASGTMDRADLLNNILGWLDDSLTFGGGGGGGAGFEEYDGPPEIVCVTPIAWDKVNGAVTQGTAGVGGQNYPDPNGSNVFGPDISAGFDYAVEYDTGVRTPGDDDGGLNGNDMDFQFPFYGFLQWDDTLGAIPGDVEAAEIIDVNYSGIALSDISADWTKFSAPYGGVFDPSALGLRPAAAWFLTETDNFGNINTASYGDAFGPNLTFSNDDDLVATEAIAHWAQGTMYGGSPAYLAWAMYPGHKSVQFDNADIAVGYYGEGDVLWEDFIADHDIQVGRDLWAYLRSDYSFTTPGEGRTVDFDYNTVFGFNGDLNRNGVAGEAADKFPVRVRFFTDVDAYDDYFDDLNGYPNFWPDGDSFIEGGCYMVDNGLPNYPVSIFDDSDEDDPKDTVSGSGPDYNVALYFELAFGVGPYDVELDWDYDFIGWGNSGYTMTLPNSPFANNGKLSDVVNVDPTPAGGDGDYFFALQVTDSSVPARTDEFFWPDAVPLQPSLSYLVVDDSTQSGDLSASQCATALTTIYGSPVSVVNSATLSPGDLNGYSVVVWCTNHRFNNSGGTGPGIVQSDYDVIAPYMDQGGNLVMFWPCQGPFSGTTQIYYNQGQIDLCKDYLGYINSTFRMYYRNGTSSSYDPHITDSGLSIGPGASNMNYIDRNGSNPGYYCGYFNDSDLTGSDAAWSFTSSRRIIQRYDSNGASEGGVALVNQFYFWNSEATSSLSGSPLGGSVAASQVIMLKNMLNYMDPLLLP